MLDYTKMSILMFMIKWNKTHFDRFSKSNGKSKQGIYNSHAVFLFYHWRAENKHMTYQHQSTMCVLTTKSSNQ